MNRIRVKVAPNVALVTIKDPQGRIQSFYSGAVLPPWATDAHAEKQVRHLLEHRLIEFVDEGTFQPSDPGRVIECLSVICGLGLPIDAGRPRVADKLRDEGFRFSNETISKAIKLFRDEDWKVGDPLE